MRIAFSMEFFKLVGHYLFFFSSMIETEGRILQSTHLFKNGCFYCIPFYRQCELYLHPVQTEIHGLGKQVSTVNFCTSRRTYVLNIFPLLAVHITAVSSK